MSDIDWTGAHCAEMDPDLWFSDLPADRRKAKALCLACPLVTDCREYGVGQEYGIWGGQDGLSDIERRRLRAQSKAREREQLYMVVKGLRDEGHGVVEIGRKLGMSHGSVNHLLNLTSVAA